MAEGTEQGPAIEGLEPQVGPSMPRPWPARLKSWALWTLATAAGSALAWVANLALGEWLRLLRWVSPLSFGGQFVLLNWG
jgi:hypothetical protein